MRLAIFGLGFIGTALADQTLAAGHQVDGFSRSGHLRDGRAIDARDEAAMATLATEWQGEPYDALVITFPPQEAAEAFWPWVHGLARRRVLLGTTSIYSRVEDCSEPLLTEGSPLVERHPRRAMEEAFEAAGGLLVRLAGLYAAERNPVRWIREGRVGYEKRQLNLVHRDDVARALLGLLALPSPRPVYNLADGERHTCRQIIDALVALEVLEAQPPKPLTRGDAFVDPSALLEALPGFRFRSLFAELPALAGALGLAPKVTAPEVP